MSPESAFVFSGRFIVMDDDGAVALDGAVLGGQSSRIAIGGRL